jgi:rod shape-determining protein MreC
LKRTFYLFLFFLALLILGRLVFFRFFETIFLSLGERVSVVKRKYEERENIYKLLIAYHQLKKQFYKNLYFLRGLKNFELYLAQEKTYQRESISAEILGFIENKEKKVIFINKGIKDGLTLGMVVVSGMTLLGKIITLFDSYAEVLLLDDEKQSVSVIFESSELRGIAKGARKHSDRSMTLVHLYDDTTKEPQKGEVVFASGKGFVFPAGYVVGTVSDIETVNYAEKIIHIKNDYDLNKIETCQILINDSVERKIEQEIKNSYN